MRGRSWKVGLTLALLVISVIILEETVSFGAFGAGGQGGGLLGPQPPFDRRLGTLDTGEIVVVAKITNLCLGPVQNSTGPEHVQPQSASSVISAGDATADLPQFGTLTFPLQNLSIMAIQVSSQGGVTTFQTNSSGVAESRVAAGTYLLAIGDRRVNMSVSLDVPRQATVVLNVSSSEEWTSALSYAYNSAGVSGEPLPWENFTAVFPHLLNYSAGENVPLIFGALPDCVSVQAQGAGADETVVPLLSVQGSQGGVSASFASPSSVGTPIDAVTLVTYTSRYQVGSLDG